MVPILYSTSYWYKLERALIRDTTENMANVSTWQAEDLVKSTFLYVVRMSMLMQLMSYVHR
jgi:hypothetical protein